jgi:uncharacterized protein (DUF58 family)
MTNFRRFEDRRRNAIYIIVGASLLAGLLTGQSLFFTITYAFIGLVFLSLFWAWTSIRWLKIERHTFARRAQVGQTLHERVTITNTGSLPKLWLEIYDQSTLPGHRASFVASNLGSRKSLYWEVNTLCLQRGEFFLGPMEVVTGDPFGLFTIRRRISATTGVLVYPAMIDIREFPLPVGLLSGGDAIRQRTHHITTNAAGVRDYAPGDSLNRIHWGSTAKRSRLMVKEFELDPLADLWIVVDLEKTVQAGEAVVTHADLLERYRTGRDTIPPTTEEYIVSIGASLSRFFLSKGRSVGLLAHGQRREIVQADRGPRQITKILEALAVIEAEGAVSFDQVITLESDQFSHGTTVILISASTRDTWVQSAATLNYRGLQAIGILVDPQSFGGRPGIERTASYLQDANIPTYLIRRSDDISVALAQQNS